MIIVITRLFVLFIGVCFEFLLIVFGLVLVLIAFFGYVVITLCWAWLGLGGSLL